MANKRIRERISPPIRHRDIRIPTFRSGNGNPDIEQANIDRLRVLIKSAYRIRFANMDEFNAYKARLVDTGLFSQGFRTRSNTLKIARGGSLGERWLFSGKLSFKNLRNEGFMAELDIELNPSRFINHCIHSHPDIEDTQQLLRILRAAEPETILERCLELPRQAVGLDENDNIIPKRYYKLARPASDILDIYWNKVLTFIRTSLEAELPRQSDFEELLNEWSLPACEIYWEYSVSDAIAFIYGVRSYVEALFNDSDFMEYTLNRAGEPDYQGPEISWQIQRNAPVLRLNPGSKNVQIKIYAKQLQRVRIEVAFTASVLGVINLGGRNRVRDSAHHINDLIIPAMEYSQRKLNRMFRHMPDLDYSKHSSFQEFVLFLKHVADACHQAGIPSKLQEMLSLLASNGRIEVKLRTSEHEFCELLLQQGVLSTATAGQNKKGYKLYRLNYYYANTLGAIKQATDNV